MSAWRDEILAVSDIAQDDDRAVSHEDTERRLNRFIEMVDGESASIPWAERIAGTPSSFTSW